MSPSKETSRKKGTAPPSRRTSLRRFALLSVAAAIVTISLKMGAYLLTGSVGLLSDALESIVNLVAAITALVVLTIATRPPDDDHAYGHDKAEYFSSGIEGGLVLLAAVSIGVSAWQRLLDPQPIDQVGVGLAISVFASLINLGVARVLFVAGRQHDSVTLQADAHHLMTDVWTSVGVVVGIVAVVLTGQERLDPIIAILVAINIVWSGVRLIRQSVTGLLDPVLPAAERDVVQRVLDEYQRDTPIQYHALRTRQSGARRFVTVHILVPGTWSVHRGHLLLERIEHDMRCVLPNATVFTHLEPLEDPVSWADQQLDREPLTQQMVVAEPEHYDDQPHSAK